MTYIATVLNAIARLRVGGGSDYPVLAKTRMTERVRSVDGQTAAAIREVEWTLISLAQAASKDARGALQDTILGHLRVRGQQVQLWEFGGASRSLPAAGGAAGSLRGYPRVEVTFLDEWNGMLSCDTWQLFQVDVRAEIPVAYTAASGGFQIAESWQSSETSYDDQELETTTFKGFVRTRADQQAASYVKTYIIDSARSAAESNNLNFTARVRVMVDTAQCEYEYTQSARGAGGWTGGDLTNVSVTDTTTERREGTTLRVISGSAEGASAATYAAGLAPTPATNQLLTASEISTPDVPRGRVSFRYELKTGVDFTAMPGIKVFSLREVIDEDPGEREILIAEFPEGNPVIWKGGVRTYAYTITTDVEFAGDWASVTAPTPPTGWEHNRSGGVDIQRLAEGANMRRVRFVQRYVFATAPSTIPTPREVPTP
jgi:hypothetical protein